MAVHPSMFSNNYIEGKWSLDFFAKFLKDNLTCAYVLSLSYV